MVIAGVARTVGTLVGINLLFAGFSIVSVGSAARGLAKRLS
jgi:uncharacterized membrane protein HdeD (DUF308 family)